MRSSSCIAGADTFICVLASDIERIAKFAEIKLVSEIAPERSDTVSHFGKCEAYNRVYDQCCGSS